MKSEVTTTKPKVSDFPKAMRHFDQDVSILATSKVEYQLTGMVIWATSKAPFKIGHYSTTWGSEYFGDIPRSECVIISND